ncbi:MAG TPA: hypothetical protein VFN67_19270 [Polyangiales bacterium]|nr:hypothetical protein [Polyangiales bacterium]
MLPADLYRVGRARFLRAVLARPAIYLSPQFKPTHEAAARANMKLAFAELLPPRAARLRAALHGRRAVSIELEM